ncbi:MAG: hypothetical protein LBU72_07800 [Burkholderiaceae bacterium]|jgi:hypothetical protein|nr:hypothetical protein [Burkholderiaceae bacterium]
MSTSFWKTRAAKLIRAAMLASMGAGACLLPALGSAQTMDVHTWQGIVKKTLPPGAGCFNASYPSTQWQAVDCANPFAQTQSVPESSRAQAQAISQLSNTGTKAGQRLSLLANAQAISQLTNTGMVGNGYAISEPSISYAEGSFLNVSGVTSIKDDSAGDNMYSLQLNTNWFRVPYGTASCDNSNGCTGWVQFVLQNYPTDALISIWYWLDGVSQCPNNLKWNGGECVYTQVQTIPQPLGNINDQVTLSGQTANGIDTVILMMGGQAYSLATSSILTAQFSQSWSQAQFNILGFGDGSAVSFNNGSSFVVNISGSDGGGYSHLSNCYNYGDTGEQNTLNHNSPCCAYGGSKPSIAFMEGTSTTNWASCTDLGDNTITPVVTPTGSGTISPYTAAQVPNGAVATFTIAPATGNQIISVTGCGGTLVGNIYTTAPANGDCTVTATFTGN